MISLNEPLPEIPSPRSKFKADNHYEPPVEYQRKMIDAAFGIVRPTKAFTWDPADKAAFEARMAAKQAAKAAL